MKLSRAELQWAEQYWQTSNYLAASMIFIKDNFFLEHPLKFEHVKDALLGHWGTCPGLNFIYTHLNLLASKKKQSTLLLTGPGHGFAAILANQYLEGTLQEYYPEMTQDRAGIGNIIKSFCWPGGFPSHLNPGVPGCIHEGGELGYALGTAFGAAFDNPDLLVVAIVGDGEAETGPTATAWHSTKWLNPRTDGAVLPIVHLNGYKINNPTVYATMSDAELRSLFTGYGYEPKFVGPSPTHQEMASAIAWAHQRITSIQAVARAGKDKVGKTGLTSGGKQIIRPRWPMILFRSLKGWTGIKTLDGHKIEGSWRSHQVPCKDAKTNPKSLKALDVWLRSYKPQTLFTATGVKPETLRFVPQGDLRIGHNPHAIGGNMKKALVLPHPAKYEVKLKRGKTLASSAEVAGEFLREVFVLNKAQRNFRIMSPDELASNKFDAVLAATGRTYYWPHSKEDNTLKTDGRVMEMLSEHTLQSWLQGYLLTGRHGVFPSYEAFMPIVDSMVSQYLKFVEMSQDYYWRTPIASMNYVLTSTAWRQDHNGFSHQNPGFINTLLNKAREEQLVRIYLPADANTMLTITDHSLRSSNRVNVIVADKQMMRQWLTYEEALNQSRVGASVWEFASDDNPDVIIAAAGDHQTQECMATIWLLKKYVPEIKVRFVNVSELNVLGVKPFYPNALDDTTFTTLFPLDRKVIFSFHGYPGAVKQLLFDRAANNRFRVYGYIEKGTTTTHFDMLVRNNVSRYHLAIKALHHAAAVNPKVAVKAALLSATFEKKLLEHRAFILEHGCDPDEITAWHWEDLN